MASNRRQDEEEKGFSCCSHGCFRFIMLFFALLIMISGGLLLSLGAYLFIVKYYLVPLLHTELYMYSIYLMCVCGFLSIASGFFSCSAARSRCGNIMYFSLMIVILIFEGLLIYTSVQYSAHTTQNLGLRLKNDVRFGYNERADIRWAIDKLQIEGKCCGAVGFTDYPKNQTEEDDEEDEMGRRKPVIQYVPDSCCLDYKPGCAISDHPSNIYYQGCEKIFTREIHNTMRFICTAAFAFFIIQGVATLVSLCTCASWRRRGPATSPLKHREQQSLFD